MNRFSRAIAGLVVFAMLHQGTGCAVIINGTQQDVTISSNTPGTTIKVDGVPINPGKVRLQRDLNHTVVAEATGSESARRVVESRMNGGWLFLDFFLWGTVFGLVMDLVSGASCSLEPDVIVFDLKAGGEQAKVCLGCGAKFAGTERFCSNCGKPR